MVLEALYSLQSRKHHSVLWRCRLVFKTVIFNWLNMASLQEKHKQFLAARAFWFWLSPLLYLIFHFC